MANICSLNWCRLCAKQEGPYSNLFVKLEESVEWIDIIRKYFKYEILIGNGQSQKICFDCTKFLQKVDEFSDNIHRAELLFRDIVNQQSNSELEDEKISSLRKKYKFDCLQQFVFIKEEQENESIEQVFTENQEEQNLYEINIYNEKENSEAENGSVNNFSEAVEYNEDIKLSSTEIIKKEKNFECESCKKKFTTDYNYNRHIESQNCINLMLKCIHCEKFFANHTKLKKHSQIHQTIDAKQILHCEFCDKTFTHSSNLRNHVKRVHLNIRSFICEDCGKMFVSGAALREHQISHTEERPVQCSQCPKRFKNTSSLRIHEDSHTNTEYVCPECGIKLNTKRLLRRHMIVHSDEKKYKCEYCGNEYKRGRTLKSHLIIHLGIKPFSCQFCDVSYANSSNCRKHMRTAHPLELAAAEPMKTHSKKIVKIPELKYLSPSGNYKKSSPN